VGKMKNVLGNIICGKFVEVPQAVLSLTLKGTVPQYFQLQVFFVLISFREYTIWAIFEYF